ncbi:MAG: hypothetical protein ABIC95_05300 [archaeon]
MRRRASAQAVMIAVLVVLALFSYFTYLYVEANGSDGNETDNATGESIGGEVKAVFTDTWNTIRVFFHGKINTTVSGIKEGVESGFINVTGGSITPGTCRFEGGLICEGLQAEWKSGRVWLKMNNRMVGDMYFTKISSSGGVECPETVINQRVRHREVFTVIMENCTLSEESAVAKVNYVWTQTHSLEKTVFGKFRIEGPD